MGTFNERLPSGVVWNACDMFNALGRQKGSNVAGCICWAIISFHTARHSHKGESLCPVLTDMMGLFPSMWTGKEEARVSI